MSAKMSAVTSQISRTSAERLSTQTLMRRHTISLRDGRQSEYIEQGHPRGEPVIYIHTLLLSGMITRSSELKCVSKGWRFIAPSRHGYGKSDRANFKSVRENLDICVNDIVQLLDHLGLEKVIVVSSRHGQRLAALYPDRVKGLITLNAAPIWHPSYLSYFNGRKRNMIKTSIHAPTAVRYLARVGKLLIDSGQERLFLKGMNRDSAVDTAALDIPEVYHVLEHGVKHISAQGVDAHAWDVQLTHTDQSADASRVKAPVTILYGSECDYMQPVVAETYASILHDARIREVKGAGTYLQHTHFDVLLGELERFR